MARCAFAIPPQVAARQMPSNLGELKQTSPKFHRISRTPVPRKRVLLICSQTGSVHLFENTASRVVFENSKALILRVCWKSG